jgi:mono/diheme cytochrome c family protein
VLLGELGCVACHDAGSGFPSIDARRGPNLTGVGNRVMGDYLPRFIADPHGVEPGTAMPDLLRGLGEAKRAEEADALAQYLQSFTEPVPPVSRAGADAAVRGRNLFHEAGCVSCHAPRAADGSELPLPGSEPLGDMAKKYTVAGLRAFLLAPQEVRPAARMPDMHLTPGEAQDLTSYLLAGAPNESTAASRPSNLDASKIAAGRAIFSERNCAQCHQLEDPQRAPARQAKPLSEVDPSRGCLSGETGTWPFYALSDEQQADIAAALRAADEPLTDEQKVRQLLASRNCIACHERGTYGGVSPERNAHFTSNDDSLGPESRLPPPLTGVGAKLQRAWLVDCVAYGQEVRPYLRTRMPGFGPAFAGELAELLARTDTLPPLKLAGLPEASEQAESLINLGRELAGDRGMGCINCHAFAGERSGMLAGIDLVDSTAQRLRREWFTQFLHAPSRFRAGTLMPQFFIGSESTRPELGDGSAAQQIDALWLYLAQGRNVRAPSGMRHEPMPLTVGNEAVILRRSVENTGKRGISVGYPGGVNLTFDAENLGMNQIWWGEFVDAAGVWTGQGSGQARILGQDRASLPKGFAFCALQNPSDPWPALSGELGQNFLGYDLDAEQRPTFHYVCEGVTITDAPQAVTIAGDSRPILRRTLSFASAHDTTLHFRAALDAHVTDLGAGNVQVGPSLRIQVAPATFHIRPAGAELELLIEVPIQQGTATLVIEYAWREQTK